MKNSKFLIAFVVLLLNIQLLGQVNVLVVTEAADNESIAAPIPDALKVREYKLENGLTVYLNEDHTHPNVFGAVVIKGGSKRDPKDATGIAHYLEHIMFKGTDRLGTTNYEAEKVFLDSITYFYDLLPKIPTPEEKFKIQENINRLSLKAAEFAIPNEFDKIIGEMGGTFVNAFTSEEMIAYFNVFPPEKIEKWLELYSHRFINPVFRMFQSELETVYEEKNMSMDNAFNRLFEEFQKNFYKNYPYGQHTVLGSVDHLKNPSITKMYEYFKTYYVANNMALIISGDFNADEIIPIINEKFGVWPTNKIPDLPIWTESGFNGKEVVKVRLTPIKIGLLGFRTMNETSPENETFEVFSQLLNNDAGTGLFDNLYNENKLLNASMISMQYSEIGGAYIIIVPKIIGQSFKKAEKLVLGEIEKIKKGEFKEEDLQTIKNSLINDFEKNMETNFNRSMQIFNVFKEGEKWEDYLNYTDKIKAVTKQDIITLANKYFGNNYLALYSKTGFPKKVKLDKPGFKPINPQNTEAKSSYAELLSHYPEKEIVPQFINFDQDVRLDNSHKYVKYYYSKNPVNEMFSMKISFGVGKYKYPVLQGAGSIGNYLGTSKYSDQEFRNQLYKIGSSLSVSANNDYLTFYINGRDDNFENTLKLIGELFADMKLDKKHLKKIVDEVKTSYKVETKDPATMGRILEEYVNFGDKSNYINRLSLKEVKKLTTDSLVNALKFAMGFEAEIHYCGKLEFESSMEVVFRHFQFNGLQRSESPITRPFVPIKENIIYVLNNKKAIQTQVSVTTEGELHKLDDRKKAKAFNQYFGADMSSLIFQELREFRSLAYSAYGTYSIPFNTGNPGFFKGNMSTQADKTSEALTAFTGLIMEMPKKPERTESMKKALLQSINVEKPTFREVSTTVAYWQKLGYKDDPRKDNMEYYRNLTFDDIFGFYSENMLNKPIRIAISGEKSRMGQLQLNGFNKIVDMDLKQIIKK